MSYFSKRTQVRERSERWERENDAPRLVDMIAGLQSLQLEVWESREGHSIPGTRYIKHIIVARSAAHFEVPCSEAGCTGGGHDLSHEVLRGLRSRETRLEGTDDCFGSVRNVGCKHTLHYVVSASYRDSVVSPG